MGACEFYRQREHDVGGTDGEEAPGVGKCFLRQAERYHSCRYELVVRLTRGEVLSGLFFGKRFGWRQSAMGKEVVQHDVHANPARIN